MDFTFTEDQITFREAISRFLMTEAAPEMLREIWETDVGRSPDLRNKIAEQGLTALSIPEAFGGLGMDDVAWALMTQELGYYAIRHAGQHAHPARQSGRWPHTRCHPASQEWRSNPTPGSSAPRPHRPCPGRHRPRGSTAQ